MRFAKKLQAVLKEMTLVSDKETAASQELPPLLEVCGGEHGATAAVERSPIWHSDEYKVRGEAWLVRIQIPDDYADVIAR